MLAAANMISNPSKALEKYSDLLCPYGCSWSAGCSASQSIHSAISAPARFTSDSMASDSKPTDPVNCQATPLSKMVVIAAPMEIQA